jgi:hypothetical protein
VDKKHEAAVTRKKKGKKTISFNKAEKRKER